VVDPWNELDHQRPAGLTETEYISQSLTKIRYFARKHGVHVWVVAHPAKLEKDGKGNYPVVRPYDISGSAHWYNKADNCISVWRNLQETKDPVQVHVQKIRFKSIGRIGRVLFDYDITTGRYKESLNQQ
jgi:twinkle protein